MLWRQLEQDNTWIGLNMSLTSRQWVLYLVVGRECMAATKVEVCGWKAGTTSSVYMPPVCRWFKLTISVITTSPVSWVKHTEKIKTNTRIKDYCLFFAFCFLFLPCTIAVCSLTTCVFSLWRQSVRPWWYPSATGTQRTACVSLTTAPATRSVRHLWECRKRPKRQNLPAL